MNEFEQLRRDPVSRRAFLRRMSAAGLGVAAASLFAGCSSGGTYPAPSGPFDPSQPDFDATNFPGIPGRSINEVVLNYALTLETLEADLYRQALNLASGRDVNAALAAGVPAPGSTGPYAQTVGNGSIASSLAPAAFLYLVQYAYVEAAHRDFLRVALQSLGAPVAAANPNGYTATFGTDLGTILELIYAVEETGVRAYLGAAPFMSFASAADKNLVQTAVAIHSTEARHSAAVAYVLGKSAGPVYSLPGVSAGRRVTDGAAAPNAAPFSDNTFQYFSNPPVVLSAVRPFLK